MRFLRIQSDGEHLPVGLAGAVLAGQLDLVQLDYHRPHIAPATTAAPPELAEYAAGFPDAVREIARPLYLDSELTLIASAGWSNSFRCVELAARALTEAGCGEVPVAAVRGSNLLPLLDMLEASGMRMVNAETGAPWKDLRGVPLLAADLQLGAAPIATALADGARVVVVGNYDPASPVTAIAVHRFGWKWNDVDKLSVAATAARAAAWHGHVGAGDPLSGPASASAAELDADGQIRVERKLPFDARDAEALARWLRGKGEGDPSLVHADVRCRMAGASIELASPQQLRIGGVTGQTGDKSWRLAIVVMAGYAAETILELAEGADSYWRHKLVSILRDDAIDPDNPAEELVARELGAIDGAGDVRWIHLTCRTSRWQGCRRFVDQLAAIAAAHRDLLRLPAGRPGIFARGESWPTRVPRDAVDLAVDTRPAKEWL